MTREASAFGEYRLFGLDLRSTIALPELEHADHGNADAIHIRTGGVAAPPPEHGNSHSLATTPEGAVLTVADVGRFCIRDGREIVVDPDPAASERNVRLFLLGSAMGVLLHQRGALPLHANAIEIDGTAVAFLGASGAGKSTLAAAFHDRSRRILSDDVCVVRRHQGHFLAEPGIPRLRLWRDAVERSGRTIHGYERAFDTLDKYTLGVGLEARAAALPLRALYLLVRNEGEMDFSIRTLSGIDAVKALMENTYRGSFIRTVGDPRTHFEACLALTRNVPLFALTRPWNVARIDETMQHVEAHLGAAGASFVSSA